MLNIYDLRYKHTHIFLIPLSVLQVTVQIVGKKMYCRAKCHNEQKGEKPINDTVAFNFWCWFMWQTFFVWMINLLSFGLYGIVRFFVWFLMCDWHIGNMSAANCHTFCTLNILHSNHSYVSRMGRACNLHQKQWKQYNGMFSVCTTYNRRTTQ